MDIEFLSKNGKILSPNGNLSVICLTQLRREDEKQTEVCQRKQDTNNVNNEEADIEITVTGTRTPRSLDESPGTITVIDVEDINNQLIQNLDDLIRYEPGVSTSGDARRYGFQDFNIRGIDGNRILLQVDGVCLPESFDFGSTQLGRNYIDTETFPSWLLVQIYRIKTSVPAKIKLVPRMTWSVRAGQTHLNIDKVPNRDGFLVEQMNYI